MELLYFKPQKCVTVMLFAQLCRQGMAEFAAKSERFFSIFYVNVFGYLNFLKLHFGCSCMTLETQISTCIRARWFINNRKWTRTLVKLSYIFTWSYFI